eukprot:4853479-Prymnesium_polylepis.2
MACRWLEKEYAACPLPKPPEGDRLAPLRRPDRRGYALAIHGLLHLSLAGSRTHAERSREGRPPDQWPPTWRAWRTVGTRVAYPPGR